MKFKLSMQEDIPPFIQQSPSLWSGKHLAPFSNVKISIYTNHLVPFSKPRLFREIGASKIKAKLVFLCSLL